MGLLNHLAASKSKSAKAFSPSYNTAVGGSLLLPGKHFWPLERPRVSPLAVLAEIELVDTFIHFTTGPNTNTKSIKQQGTPICVWICFCSWWVGRKITIPSTPVLENCSKQTFCGNIGSELTLRECPGAGWSFSIKKNHHSDLEPWTWLA